MTLPLLPVGDPDLQFNLDQIAKQFPVAAVGGVPTGTAGGDLAGAYPNPTVTKAQAGFTVGGLVVVLAGTAAGGDLAGTYPNPIVPGKLPAGGTTGQVLTKNTGADYDTGWVTPAAGGGSAPTFVSQAKWNVD